MTPHFFDMHEGHLPRSAHEIARQYGGRQVNYTEPNGQKRGWFEVPDYGEHDPRTIVPREQIRAAIRAAGVAP